jgi:hypothetical protein
MNAANDKTRLVDDLAALWTEPVLEILKASGTRHVSVDLELAVWHTLRKVIRIKLGNQAFRSATLAPLASLMEQVLRRATVHLILTFHVPVLARAVEKRVFQEAGGRIATPTERRIYAELIRQPGTKNAFKPLSGTDYLPRLQAVMAPA